MGFPKIRGTVLGANMVRIVVVRELQASRVKASSSAFGVPYNPHKNASHVQKMATYYLGLGLGFMKSGFV